VLENQAFGIEFYTYGYQVLRYQQPEWLLIESQSEPQINENIVTGLLLDGLSQELQQELASSDEYLPHIICCVSVLLAKAVKIPKQQLIMP